MAEKGVGGGVELFRQPGPADEIAHQDEQRHDRQGIGFRRVARDLCNQREGGRPVDQEGVADRPDQRHGEGDRQAQEHQDQERGETQGGGKHG